MIKLRNQRYASLKIVLRNPIEGVGVIPTPTLTEVAYIPSL